MAKRKGAPVKKVRQAQTTVLIVGEGDSDVAFIKHLCRLYNVRGCGVAVTVHNAHGYGPENVIEVTARNRMAFDRRVALLDTDLEWSFTVRNRAKSEHIEMLPSEPCLEGLLLLIMEKSVPDRSDQCKKVFKEDDLKSLIWYEKHLSQQMLNQRREKVSTLARLIELVSCSG